MYKPGYRTLSSLSTLTADIRPTRFKELTEFSLYSLLAFSIPFMLAGPQLFVGTLVNMSLIGSALYVKGRKLLPIMILPSLGVLSRGVLFGPLTMYLLYMLPFIWLGNAVLVLSVKYFHLRLKQPYAFGAVLGSVLKFALLFSSTYLLYALGVVPAAFLVAMGAMQLLTAVSAGILLWPINRLRTKVRK